MSIGFSTQFFWSNDLDNATSMALHWYNYIVSNLMTALPRIFLPTFTIAHAGQEMIWFFLVDIHGTSLDIVLADVVRVFNLIP